MKLNEEQKISLENLYSHLNQEKEYLKDRKENTKWFYILSAIMVLIIYLDGFGKEKYEPVVYLKVCLCSPKKRDNVMRKILFVLLLVSIFSNLSFANSNCVPGTDIWE